MKKKHTKVCSLGNEAKQDKSSGYIRTKEIKSIKQGSLQNCMNKWRPSIDRRVMDAVLYKKKKNMHLHS